MAQLAQRVGLQTTLASGHFMGKLFVMTASNFGVRLRAARLHMGLSGRVAAQRLHCATGTLYRWERGEFQPSLEKIEQLAELYETSISYLLEGKNGNAA
jgi:transcriptional regulator with XRE-family HTH domain